MIAQAKIAAAIIGHFRDFDCGGATCTRTRNCGDFRGLCIPLQTVQVSSQIGGGLITERAIFLKAFIDHRLKLCRKIGIEAYRRSWRLVQNCIENNCGSVSSEWLASRGHFVHHGAERKQIGAGVQVFAAGLFRRHVSHGAHGAAGAGEIGVNGHGRQ